MDHLPTGRPSFLGLTASPGVLPVAIFIILGTLPDLCLISSSQCLLGWTSSTGCRSNTASSSSWLCWSLKYTLTSVLYTSDAASWQVML